MKKLARLYVNICFALSNLYWPKSDVMSFEPSSRYQIFLISIANWFYHRGMNASCYAYACQPFFGDGSTGGEQHCMVCGKDI